MGVEEGIKMIALCFLTTEAAAASAFRLDYLDRITGNCLSHSHQSS